MWYDLELSVKHQDSSWVKFGLMMDQITRHYINNACSVNCKPALGKQEPGLDHCMAGRLHCFGNVIQGRVL